MHHELGPLLGFGIYYRFNASLASALDEGLAAGEEPPGSGLLSITAWLSGAREGRSR